MDKLKEYFMKVVKILSLKELRILPAYLAYNLVLAIVPIITIIAVVASTFSISIDTVIRVINDMLPAYASEVIIGAISGNSFDITVGVLNLATFVISTNGMYAIVNVSNSLYKIESTSPIKDRMKSLLILILIIALIFFLIIVPMLGHKIIELLSNYNLSKNTLNNITLVYNAIKWPISFLLIFFNIKLIYMIAPSTRIKGEDTTVGALVTTIGWALFTAVFGYYINFFGKYDIIYGGLASIIILLIWFYVLSYILVFGIIINTLKYNKDH